MHKFQMANDLFSKWNVPNSPGASAAVLVNGEIVYKNGFGYSNIEYDIPNTPSTIFHVASVSKQFTAMAILLLESDGKLDIHDDIHEYLPELPDFGHEITIEHLIHHTSGLRDQWELLYLAGWRDDDVTTREHVLKMVKRQKALNFEPGTRFLYSNTGYNLMVEIVERITGKPFPEFTKERIFKPLGMNNTHFHDDNDMIVKNRAYSYKIDLEQGYKKSVLNFSTLGATSLFTTVEDLVKWGYNYNTMTVGGPKVIENMQKRYTLKNGETIPYAGGVKISQYRGLKTIEHNGADAGFRSSIVCFPDEKTVIAVLSNTATFKPEYYAKKLADIFIPDSEFKCEDSFSFSNYYKDENDDNKIDDIEKLVGNYMTDPGIVFNVEAKNGELFISIPETPKLKLLNKKGNTYIAENAETLIRWNILEGKIKGFDVVNPYYESFAEKLNTIDIDEKELYKYTGTYYSEELDTFYDFEIEDGFLVAKHNRHEDSKLLLYQENRFVSESWGNHLSGDILFELNQGSQVIGFHITTGRVINLWFNKVG